MQYMQLFCTDTVQDILQSTRLLLQKFGFFRKLSKWHSQQRCIFGKQKVTLKTSDAATLDCRYLPFLEGIIHCFILLHIKYVTFPHGRGPCSAKLSQAPSDINKSRSQYYACMIKQDLTQKLFEQLQPQLLVMLIFILNLFSLDARFVQNSLSP